MSRHKRGGHPPLELPKTTDRHLENLEKIEMPLRSAPAYYVLSHLPSRRFYLGSTDDLYRRINNHRSQLTRGTHPNSKLQEVFTDWNDMHLDYQYYPTKGLAKEREQNSLDRFYDNERCCNLYNDASGHWLPGTMPKDHSWRRVNVGRIISDDRAKKVSEVHSGKIVNQETRDLLRQTSLSRGPNATAKKAVIIEGYEYPSILAASKALGIPHPTVRNRVNSEAPVWKEWQLVD